MSHVSMRSAALSMLAMASVAALAGCQPKSGVSCQAAAISMESLVAHHNTDADRVPALWAEADIEVRYRDDKGQDRRHRLTDGLLYLGKVEADPFGPQNFMLRGREIGQEFLRLGVDAAGGRYYLWIAPPNQDGEMYWGQTRLIDQPGVDALPADPLQVLSVLGVLPWRADAKSPPMPVMMTLGDPCVYELLFVDQLPGRPGLFVRRKVWVDRNGPPYHPSKMWLFDADRKVILVATLGRYRPIETDDGLAPPEMPTDILIEWPDRHSSLRLRLDGMTILDPVPDAAYRRIDAPATIPAENIHQLDRAYGPATLEGAQP